MKFIFASALTCVAANGILPLRPTKAKITLTHFSQTPSTLLIYDSAYLN